MNVKHVARDPERCVLELAFEPPKLTLLDSENQREAQLLRLGLGTRAFNSDETAFRLSGELSTSSLREYAREYLSDCELFNKAQ